MTHTQNCKWKCGQIKNVALLNVCVYFLPTVEEKQHKHYIAEWILARTYFPQHQHVFLVL